MKNSNLQKTTLLLILLLAPLSSTTSTGEYDILSTSTAAPEIWINPTSLNLTIIINNSPQTYENHLTVGNNGTADLGFNISTNESWITVAPASSTIAPDEIITINITLHTNLLATGTHATNIILQNNDPEKNPLTVPVIINITTTLKTLHCGDTITQDTTMANDLIDCEQGLTIGADNIILDCGGHTIGMGGGDWEDIGVLIANRENVTVKNCTIRDSGVGILVKNANSITITSNKILHHIEGLRGFEFTNLHIANNEITNNYISGIGFFDSQNTTILNNTIRDNEVYGIYSFSNNYGVVVEYNNIFDNLLLNLHNLYCDYPVHATYNWWGTSSCDTVSSRIRGNVSFSPILDAPYPDGKPIYCSNCSSTTTTTSTSSTTIPFTIVDISPGEGYLPAGTNSVLVNVITNENATCYYSTSPGDFSTSTRATEESIIMDGAKEEGEFITVDADGDGRADFYKDTQGLSFKGMVTYGKDSFYPPASLKEATYNNPQSLLNQTSVLPSLENPSHRFIESIVVDYDKFRYYEDGLGTDEEEDLALKMESGGVKYVLQIEDIPLTTLYDASSQTVDFGWRGGFLFFGEEYYTLDIKDENEVKIAKGEYFELARNGGQYKDKAEYRNYIIKIEDFIVDGNNITQAIVFNVTKPDGTVVQVTSSASYDGIVDDIEIFGIYAEIDSTGNRIAHIVVYDMTTTVIFTDSKDVIVGGETKKYWEVDFDKGLANDSTVMSYHNAVSGKVLHNITLTYRHSTQLKEGLPE